MAFIVAVYNVIALGGGVTGHDTAAVLAHGMTFTMFSGDKWTITLSDVILLAALVLLFAEIVKSARGNSREIGNHAFSMIVFVVALVEFIVVRGFSTSTFFLILAMCLFDVVAGYTIAIRAAEHDIGFAPKRE